MFLSSVVDGPVLAMHNSNAQSRDVWDIGGLENTVINAGNGLRTNATQQQGRYSSSFKSRVNGRVALVRQEWRHSLQASRHKLLRAFVVRTEHGSSLTHAHPTLTRIAVRIFAGIPAG